VGSIILRKLTILLIVHTRVIFDALLLLYKAPTDFKVSFSLSVSL